MKYLGIAAMAAVATAIQVAWASPDAPSSADLSAAPWAYLPWLCLPAMAVAATAWFCGRHLPPRWRSLPVSLAMAGYWLLLDVYEFTVRVAAWSTFSTPSLWLHALRNAALPLLVCSAAFALSGLWLAQRTPAPGR